MREYERGRKRVLEREKPERQRRERESERESMTWRKTL